MDPSISGQGEGVGQPVGGEVVVVEVLVDVPGLEGRAEEGRGHATQQPPQHQHGEARPDLRQKDRH